MLGGAEVLHIQLPVFQCLGVTEYDLLPRCAGQLYGDYPRDVLPEITDQFPGGRTAPRHRLQHFVGRDRLPVPGADGRTHLQLLLRRGPPDGGSGVPVGVVGLAVIEVREPPGAVLRDLKALVRADDLRAAVLVLQAELRQKRLPLGAPLGDALVGIRNIGGPAHGPASGHNRSKNVFPRLEIMHLVTPVL